MELLNPTIMKHGPYIGKILQIFFYGRIEANVDNIKNFLNSLEVCYEISDDDLESVIHCNKTIFKRFENNKNNNKNGNTSTFQIDWELFCCYLSWLNQICL